MDAARATEIVKAAVHKAHTKNPYLAYKAPELFSLTDQVMLAIAQDHIKLVDSSD